MSTTPKLDEAFSESQYTIRQKVFKFLGRAFHIYNQDGECKFYSKQKAFKLKEDIRIYSDETKSKELLVIKARNVIDFGATYDVIDPNRDNEAVGSLRRKGMKSIVVDEWLILDAAGEEIGKIKEDNIGLAILRRLVVGWLLPQVYTGSCGDDTTCTFTRNFNPFVSKIRLDFSMDQSGQLDRRLGLSAAILLVAIDKKQS
ncbi:MAG: hypothetical protein MK095_09295 [Phycisphaerales bacterium]|nr:hypothetical protein [Phycisphaerales bacterium]